MVDRSDGTRSSLPPLAAVAAVAALLVAACSGSAGAPVAAPTAAPPDAPPDVEGAPRPGATAPPVSADGTLAGSLIVRTGTLELEVADVDAVLPPARDLVTRLGGYVSGSDEADEGGRHVATIAYRIPVERWQEAIDGLRALAARVLREATQAEEVTAQVVDLNARIENLRASEASLREIMDRAGTIEDVLRVQERLDAVREQIERLVAQQQDLTGRAALATLSVTWLEPVVAVEEAQSGWDLGREIDRAAAQTVAAAQAFVSLLVWLVLVGVPVFGPVVLLLLAGVWLFRRYAAGRPTRPRQTGWTPLPPADPPAGPS